MPDDPNRTEEVAIVEVATDEHDEAEAQDGSDGHFEEETSPEAQDPVPLPGEGPQPRLIGWASKVRLPGLFEPDPRMVVGLVAILLVALLVGTGAWLIGKSTGVDLEAARQEGTAAGEREGAIMGAERGYAKGFNRGRGRGFRTAYEPAYRIYYKRAFEQAGLDPPPDDEFGVPDP